ncbi:hypothetical protein ACLOJK_036590, partial [Asimina triloba]
MRVGSVEAPDTRRRQIEGGWSWNGFGRKWEAARIRCGRRWWSKRDGAVGGKAAVGDRLLRRAVEYAGASVRRTQGAVEVGRRAVAVWWGCRMRDGVGGWMRWGGGVTGSGGRGRSAVNGLLWRTWTLMLAGEDADGGPLLDADRWQGRAMGLLAVVARSMVGYGGRRWVQDEADGTSEDFWLAVAIRRRRRRSTGEEDHAPPVVGGWIGEDDDGAPYWCSVLRWGTVN